MATRRHRRRPSPSGQLTPGFHGLHIHSVGKCEPNSVARPGRPGDFNSAGGHFQVAGPHRASRQRRPDLAAGARRRLGDAGDHHRRVHRRGPARRRRKTAIIIHEKADNFANIPPSATSRSMAPRPPDETTLATGDAGKRVACGVISGRGQAGLRPDHIAFTGSPRPTVGVEWEFALVDPDHA